MAEPTTQTVTFQAAATNSKPPPPSGLPYHIDQAVNGEVGTLRFPAELSRRSQFLIYFITVFNFVGLIWVLWRVSPILSVILAICAAASTLSLSGLFHGQPYLNERRKSWVDTSSNTLKLSFVVSLATSCVVSWFLIFQPPKIPNLILSFGKKNSRSISDLRSAIRTAKEACEDRIPGSCDWAGDLSAELNERTHSRAEAPTDDPTDIYVLWALYTAAFIAFAAAHRIATYGGPLSSEIHGAIWREPHGGYNSTPGVQIQAADPNEKVKREGLNRWLRTDRISIGSGSEVTPVDKVFEEYIKFLREQIVMPPAYDFGGFKRAFKDVANKEPQDVKGTLSYVGVSFHGGGLG